jgi:hypothetical protein
MPTIAAGRNQAGNAPHEFLTGRPSLLTGRWRLTARPDTLSARMGFVQPRRITPGPTVIRNRPESGSLRRGRARVPTAASAQKAPSPRPPGWCAGTAARGRPQPNSSVLTHPSTASRTLLAHITSPPRVAGQGPAPWPSFDRPLQLSRPAALTALGARGLPPSPAAAKSRASPHRVCCDAAGCQLVQHVEPGTDDAMAAIEIPAPQNPDAAHLRINSSEESPLSGVQAPCPVYVRSPNQLNTSAQFNAPHMMHRST